MNYEFHINHRLTLPSVFTPSGAHKSACGINDRVPLDSPLCKQINTNKLYFVLYGKTRLSFPNSKPLRYHKIAIKPDFYILFPNTQHPITHM